MKNQILLRQSEAGFTLIELLAVIIMVGVLSAIAVPSWLGFVNQQRITSAQNRALTLLRDAQVNAGRERVPWQACFWADSSQMLGSVHRVGASEVCTTTNAVSLTQGEANAIEIDSTNSTFTQNPTNYYQVQFKYDGSVKGPLGKITFKPRNSNTKRCVIVATLLGTMRSDKDNACTL